MRLQKFNHELAYILRNIQGFSFFLSIFLSSPPLYQKRVLRIHRMAPMINDRSED